MGAFSIHFDARKLVEVLSEIAKERGIIHIEGEVIDFTEDEHGDVATLKLAHGAEIQTDFIFDCSGFKSFFKEKFDSEWVSHSEHLTVDSAIPFFLEMDDEVPAYTEAIAMDHGWIWKIPLQDRYGCGYVYNSEFISEEDAKEEIVSFLGYEPKWPRDHGLKFQSGYVKEPWKKNVVLAGLASSFIEPLEATSIWLSIINAARILGNTEVMYKRDSRLQDDYNKISQSMQKAVAGFIYLHYMTGRKDTPFWKHYTKENAPKYLQDMLDIAEVRNLIFEDIAPEAQWSLESWYNILVGIKHEGTMKNLKDFEFYNFSRSYIKNAYHFYKKTVESVANNESITHNEFLEKLNEKE
jgi:tryptophan halogenase